jgi:hypothetical protein
MAGFGQDARRSGEQLSITAAPQNAQERSVHLAVPRRSAAKRGSLRLHGDVARQLCFLSEKDRTIRPPTTCL